MLQKTTAHFLSEVGKSSLEGMKEFCYQDFVRTLELFVQSNFFDGRCGLHNYSAFDSFCGKEISYNTKNTQYEELLSGTNFNLRFYKEMESGSKCVSSETSNGYLKLISSVKEKEEPLYKVLFGAGEFPFMLFTIARIGNTDYFWYSITR